MNQCSDADRIMTCAWACVCVCVWTLGLLRLLVLQSDTKPIGCSSRSWDLSQTSKPLHQQCTTWHPPSWRRPRHCQRTVQARGGTTDYDWWQVSTASTDSDAHGLSRVHTGSNVDATLSNATSRMIPSTKSKQIEHVQFVSTLSTGRNFTKNSFNIVAKRATMSKQRSTLSNKSFDW